MTFMVPMESLLLFAEEFVMTRWVGRMIVLQALLVALLSTGACKKAAETSNPAPRGMPPGGDGDRGQASAGIKVIMAKLTKGPQSLTSVIGKELEADPPPWDKIQEQTREYVQLASSMKQYESPTGKNESWPKFTTSYAETAAALDKAAQAKDRDAALTAHKTIVGSCMACHSEHKPKGGGRGRPGG